MEWELAPRTGGTPIHIHPHASESYEVLEGEFVAGEQPSEKLPSWLAAAEPAGELRVGLQLWRAAVTLEPEAHCNGSYSSMHSR